MTNTPTNAQQSVVTQQPAGSVQPVGSMQPVETVQSVGIGQAVNGLHFAGTVSAVAAVPAGSAEEARRHFATRLAFETDVSDVAADLAAGVDGVVVVDTRNAESWAQGHIPGAVHLPTAEIAERADAVVPLGVTVVVHCWGPGCNGAQKAALEFAQLGRPVKEMIGGFEYWAREGFPVERGGAVTRRSPDPLTAPTSGAVCDC